MCEMTVSVLSKASINSRLFGMKSFQKFDHSGVLAPNLCVVHGAIVLGKGGRHTGKRICQRCYAFFIARKVYPTAQSQCSEMASLNTHNVKCIPG